MAYSGDRHHFICLVSLTFYTCFTFFVVERPLLLFPLSLYTFSYYLTHLLWSAWARASAIVWTFSFYYPVYFFFFHDIDFTLTENDSFSWRHSSMQLYFELMCFTFRKVKCVIRLGTNRRQCSSTAVQHTVRQTKTTVHSISRHRLSSLAPDNTTFSTVSTINSRFFFVFPECPMSSADLG